MTIKAIVFDAYGTLYDVQSVAEITEDAFPGYGDIITQVWRIKQLEYSWLRTLMRRYQDFSTATRDSLAYTLRCLGLQYDEATFGRHHRQVSASCAVSGCRRGARGDERQKARDPLQRQP
ncbi:2-haloalkanoic acid dehalogenase type II [Bradyrhizobium sp. USDA 4011]